MARKQPNRETATADQETAISLEERIRARAFEIWADKGYPEGAGIEDWLEAEREIMSQTAAGTAVSTAA
jgi:hypothetical protein